MIKRFVLVSMFLGTLSISGLTHGALAADSDCPSSDLNAPDQSPFRSLPVYDQDGTATCYAHAAVEMVDYWRLQHGAKSTELINPVYAAWVDHYENRNIFLAEKTTSAGHCSDAIDALKSQGYCKNSQVEACLAEYKKQGPFSDAELVHFLETIYDNYTIYTAENSYNRAVRLTKKDSWVGGRCDSLAATLKTKDLMGVSATQIMADLFSNCKPKQKLTNIPKPRDYNDWTDEAINGRIDTALNHKSPVAISMCSKVFSDPTHYRGLIGDSGTFSSFLTRNASANIKDDCGGHAVLITGRAKINGVCKYMVRNSWGAFWKGARGTQCACISDTGQYQEVCNSSHPREYVGCWFNKQDLIPNIYQVTTL
jgi:hypothetical protein